MAGAPSGSSSRALREAYAEMRCKPGDLPITEQLAHTVLSLPMGPHLQAEQMQYVIDSVESFRG